MVTDTALWETMQSVGPIVGPMLNRSVELDILGHYLKGFLLELLLCFKMVL